MVLLKIINKSSSASYGFEVRNIYQAESDPNALFIEYKAYLISVTNLYYSNPVIDAGEFQFIYYSSQIHIFLILGNFYHSSDFSSHNTKELIFYLLQVFIPKLYPVRISSSLYFHQKFEKLFYTTNIIKLKNKEK